MEWAINPIPMDPQENNMHSLFAGTQEHMHCVSTEWTTASCMIPPGS